MNTTELNKLFRQSASNALAEWYGSQWDRQKEALDDLVQDLWVWYSESVVAQQKVQQSERASVSKMVYKTALQRLANQVFEQNIFRGRNLYSVDAIKDALLGRSTNKYLLGILPTALEALDKRNAKQAEAIRCRYQDGVVPTGAAADRLRHSLKALADEVNVNYITAPVKGVGSRNVVFPHTRKQKGVHSDPTGGTAIALIENPHVRDQYLERTRWLQIDEGAAAEPVFDLGNGVKYRATGKTARLLRNYPDLIGPFVETKRKELFG